MTEAEWLVSNDPKKMLELLQGKGSERKMRLFAVACCRHSLQCMIEVYCRKAVEVAELYADGLATEEELRIAHLGVDPVWGESRAFAAWASDNPVQAEAICKVQRPTWVNHAVLLRDIFGNPFRFISIDPNWLLWNDGTVKYIAQRIYHDRAFDHLPVLAEVLEKSGYTDADILNHCRQQCEHVRGCWVVDLILGKK